MTLTVVGAAAPGAVYYDTAKNAPTNREFDRAIRDCEKFCGITLDKDQRQRGQRATSGQHLGPGVIIGVAITIFGCQKDPGRIGR